MDFFIRAIVFILFGLRAIYWIVTEFQSHREKPLSKKPGLVQILKRLMTFGLGVLIALQLLGLSVLPFYASPFMQFIGLVVVIISFVLSISARRTLGANWAHAADYQIKKNHELVTGGVYQYIRHPIYTSFILSLVGAELVVGSYLVFLMLVLSPYVAYKQARKEEKILTDKFGEKYKHYMKKTTRFFPYVW